MVVTIARTVLHPQKKFHIALKRIFGIGRVTGVTVAEACGISKELKTKDVKESYVQQVQQYIQDNHLVGDALKRKIRDDILQMMHMRCYRGVRHEAGLPVHGQRTGRNASTAKKLIHHIMYDVK